MRNINEIRLRGRLGQDAENRSTQSGKKVTRLNLATSRRYLDKQTDEWRDTPAQWHTCICWENVSKKASTFKKGDAVQLTGALQSREYEKDGVKHRVWEVIVDDLVKIETPAKGDAAEPEAATATAGPGDLNDEIPF